MASRFPLRQAASPDTQSKVAETFRMRCLRKVIEGEPAGHGLYIWTRGDEIRYEEPPLCTRCANAIAWQAPPNGSSKKTGE